MDEIIMKIKFLLILSLLAFGSLKAYSSCVMASGTVYLDPSNPANNSELLVGNVSNVAFGQYFLDQSIQGGGLISTFQAFPGFFSNNRYGFIGSSTTLYTSVQVLPTASPGAVNISQRIIDVAGRIICSGSFQVVIL
ncbi:hypothetical protein [Microbulbifer sp. TYP-18]|uniref:hypothetical protein n=1 Tax=Microbulbifer sp. TYP-18 TaxID=3230024 RepID=UPI0034C62263